MNETAGKPNGINGVAHARPPRSRAPGSRKRKASAKVVETPPVLDGPSALAGAPPAVVVDTLPTAEPMPEPEPPIKVKGEAPAQDSASAPVAEGAEVSKEPADTTSGDAPRISPPDPQSAPPEVSAATPEPPPVIWYRPIEQPSFPVAEALRQMPSSVIYSPDVDLRPIKGLGFDLRAWGYGQVALMKLAEARRVRLADGREEECPKGETIIVPIVTDLEAIIPAMMENPDVAVELEFAPIGMELSPDGTVRIRFAVLPPKPTEIPREALWGAKSAE